MTNINNYYGRLFTKNQLTKEERDMAISLPSKMQGNACFRCGSPFLEQHSLPNGACYCRSCILLGRVRTDELLYYFPQVAFPRQKSLTWQGQLSEWQQTVSDQLIENVRAFKPTLVHAVTGAGKTEMIYQTVASIIDQGGAVCLASPRIDVCIELYKRLSRDFSCPISLLYGDSDPYIRSPLVIATTHQLLTFYQAFDLLLIDEVDAFPYVENPMLYRAAELAIKPSGVTVFLTATSTEKLNRKVRSGELHRLNLPRRFHGNPLVVPKKVWFQGFEKGLHKKKIPLILEKAIRKQRDSGYPLLLFIPEIQMGKDFMTILQNVFPKETIGFVSSQSEDRLQIVENFRQNEVGILISTTILERGVTFPCIDVFVIQANHHLYSSSSLVQIAGRVGRSMDRPTGDLVFFHEGSTKVIEQAIKEIKKMNQEAGYD